MGRVKVFERPTPELRWLDGILQQSWMLQWSDDETRGAANPQTFEWRDIPVLSRVNMSGSDLLPMDEVRAIDLALSSQDRGTP